MPICRFDYCKTSFYIKHIALSQNMLGNDSYLNTKINSDHGELFSDTSLIKPRQCAQW